MLHLATFLKKMEIINILLNEKNVEIIIKDSANITPYDIANILGYKEIIKIFEKKIELKKNNFLRFNNYYDLIFIFNNEKKNI